MKKCTRCKQEKNEIEFHKDRTAKDGFEYRCKHCKSELSRERRQKDPEKAREIVRRSTKKNYESVRASQRKHRLENREKINARRREQRKPRAAELNAKENQRRKNDPNFLIGNRIRYKKYYEKNKEKLLPKRRAHQLVLFAIKLGFLKRPNKCERCAKECKPHGHHTDYSKPLDVIWFCHSCHKMEHLIDGESIPPSSNSNSI